MDTDGLRKAAKCIFLACPEPVAKDLSDRLNWAADEIDKINGMDDVEALADYAHKAWAGWMKYLFEKSEKNEDGTVTIPAWAVERWQRQVETSYEQLPESEKASDRKEAKEILDIINH